jgi:hypothetical protein
MWESPPVKIARCGEMDNGRAPSLEELDGDGTFGEPLACRVFVSTIRRTTLRPPFGNLS